MGKLSRLCWGGAGRRHDEDHNAAVLREMEDAVLIKREGFLIFELITVGCSCRSLTISGNV